MNYTSSIARKVATKAYKRIKRYIAPLTDSQPVTVQSLDSKFQEIGVTLNEFIEYRSLRPTLLEPVHTAILRKTFADRFATEHIWIMQRANDAVSRKFDVLGSGPTNLSDSANGVVWNKDLVSGVTWPMDHFMRVPTVMLDTTSDIKNIWEVSRFQFAVNLAQAEILTGDKQYRQSFIDLVDDWQRKNPYPLGPNWMCAMEVSIRAINMLLAFEYFNHSDQLPEGVTRALFASLYQHGRHIRANLEDTARGMNTNHYLADLLGLLTIGTLFDVLPEARSWQNFAISELTEEIQSQTTDDGFCYESSSAYHLLTLEMYLFVHRVCRLNKMSLPLQYVRRLVKMAAFTSELTGPNFRLPMIGDNDSGRIFTLAPRCDCDPAWLVLWARMEGLLTSEVTTLEPRQTAESVWLLGQKEAPRATAAEPSPAQLRKCGRSKSFKDSGIALLKQDDLRMTVNIGDIGVSKIGGHKHNDQLAITLTWGPSDFITDPGALTYTRDEEIRNKSRSILSHSTVSLDNKETNRFLPGYLFALKRDGAPNLDTWLSTPEMDLLVASHDCYKRLPGSPRILRTILFDKLARFWLIRDQFENTRGVSRENQPSLTSSIVTDTEVTSTDDGAFRLTDSSHTDDNQSITIRTFTIDASINCEQWFTAPAYNVSKPATAIRMQAPQSTGELIWGIFANRGIERRELNNVLIAERMRLLEWSTLNVSLGPHALHQIQ